MNFDHTEERQMLSDSLSRHLEKNYDFETRLQIADSQAGWSARKWRELAELGIVAVLLSEKVGGLGGDGFDIAVVFEQLGKALVVEPFLGALMAGRIVARSDKQQLIIDELMEGSCCIAFANWEMHGRYDAHNIATRATHGAQGWTLSGRKAVVPQIEAADHIVVSARLDGCRREETGTALFLIARNTPGVRIQGYPLIDGGRGGDLALENAPATLLVQDPVSAIEEAIAAGIVALSWEAVGIMDVLMDTTLDYLRTRKQFGVPIGQFQALQHRMATVALEIEQARSAATNAADALGGERIARERAASAAKYTIGRVGTLVAEEAIQMHGGIGMTWELPLSHYAKRLTMIGHQLGDEDYHLARYTALGRAA